MKKIEWISHRGESADAPENTCAAFRLAMERDTNGMETDVHLTSDNVLVCIHDSDTKRVAGVQRIVEQTPFSELRTLDVSYGKSIYKGEPIPTFAEALAILKPGKTFYVEIKENNESVVSVLKKELEKAGTPPEQIVIISFHKEMVAASKRILPEFRALWLTGFKEEKDGFHPTPQETLSVLTETKADGIDACAVEKAFHAEYIKQLKYAGFHIAVWTVDETDAARHWLEAGVDSVTSNCAARIRTEIEGY